VEVRDEQAAAEGVTAGLEILEVNGTPVRQYAEREVAPYQSASTPQDRDSRTYERALLAGPVGEPVRVTFANAAGERFERTLRRLENGGPETGTTAFEYRVLPGNVAYVALRSFGDPRVAAGVEQAFAELSRADAWVLDIRENGGGNSSEGYRILAMLTDRPFKGTRWRTREYRPTARAWGWPERYFDQEAVEVPADGTRLYDKPVVLLTSARTGSSAEDFAVAFDAMGRGLMIGEPTAGTTGQPLFLQLPGGGYARVCTKQDAYPDGRPFVGQGVQPQRRVHPTVEDVRAGRDTVLEAALEELKQRRAGVR
jgi:carboxyl-terminal processing protease